MSEHSPTSEWIGAARAGDRLALAKLLITLHPRLRVRAEGQMSAAVRARSSPEDILQDVYLEVARQVGRFEDRGPGSFDAWVQTILDHKLIDAHRALFRQARDVDREVRLEAGASGSYENLLDMVYAESGTPSRVARRQEALGALLTCISDLPEEQRKVVQFRFLDGLSVREVAARVGKSEDAVVALCQRAVKGLRQALDRMGEFTRGG